MSKILITGASGYVGSKLVRKLAERSDGKLTMYLLVHKENISQDILSLPGVKLVDSSTIYRHDYDCIYHIAAAPDKGDAPSEYLISLLESNFILTAKMLLLARDQNIPIVCASSYSQYEEMNTYRFAKAMSEQYASILNFEKYTFVRFTDIYGEDDPRRKVFNLFRESVDRKQTFIFKSPAHKPINFTHIDDITDGLIYTMEHPWSHSHIVDLIYKENVITLGDMAKQINPTMEYAEFPADNEEDGVYKIPTDKNRLKGFKLTHKVDFRKGE